MTNHTKPEARFWLKVNMSGGPDACWPWLGSCNDDGYGRFGFDGRVGRAHVFAFTREHELPHGMIVCHSCDNPPCCNPGHLFSGTHRVNALDRERKMRRILKLTLDQVSAIVSDPRAATVIAADYGVSAHHVRRLKRRGGWTKTLQLIAS
jgi:hypothetical protein